MARKNKQEETKPVTALDFYAIEEIGPPAGVHLEGRTVILKPEYLLQCRRTRQGLLWHATGGFGCDPDSRGRTIFLTSKLNGETTSCNRYELAGVYLGPTFEPGDLVVVKPAALVDNPSLVEYQDRNLQIREARKVGSDTSWYCDYYMEETADLRFPGSILQYAGPSETIWPRSARYEDSLKMSAELLVEGCRLLNVPVNITFDLGIRRVHMMWPPDCVIPGPVSLEPVDAEASGA